MALQIGAQYYTIRDFCQTLEDFRESCKKVSEIGYKTVQLSGIGDFKAEEIKPILDEFGLQAVCTHRPPQNYLEKLDEEIAFHKTLGCKIAGIGCMPAFNTKPETIAEFAKNYRPVAEQLGKEGLLFGYHNHAFEFAKTDGRFAFEFLCDAMACDSFKLILDVYWLAVAGLNPAKFIKAYADKIACLHFKDLKIVENASAFAEVGQGNLDWDEIISVTEEAGIPYALVEQDICDTNPFDCLKTSYDFLQKKGLQ